MVDDVLLNKAAADSMPQARIESNPERSIAGQPSVSLAPSLASGLLLLPREVL